MNWYLTVLKNYAGFSCRARRQEFWMFYLLNIFLIMVVSIMVFLTKDTDTILESFAYGLSSLFFIYSLIILIHSLAVSVRRLHDVGKSGWFLLIGLIPFIGGIILLVFMCLDSEAGENKYGPNPKEKISC